MTYYNDRCPECDSRYCGSECRRTDTAYYVVGSGYIEFELAAKAEAAGERHLESRFTS